MANRVTMNICGEDYTLIAEESPSYMERVGKLVDEKLSEVLSAGSVSRTDAAILAAINLADELLKAQESGENLRRQVKTYLDEAAQAKNEASELKRQLFRAQNRK
ncbi:MAG: cell division protein ZapA [Oscillospiraceae bacterium]|nr:cell division protein ZapA [Oscillospiraceae bacterium]